MEQSESPTSPGADESPHPVNATAAALFILQELKIRYANAAAGQLTGYSPAELAGMAFWELCAPAERARLQSAWSNGDAAELPPRLVFHTRGGQSQPAELMSGELEMAGRPARWVSACPAGQAFQHGQRQAEERPAGFTSMTEAVVTGAAKGSVGERLLAELEIEHARLLAVIENAPEGILVVDREGRLVLANPAAERLQILPAYGLSEADRPGVEVCRPDGTRYDLRQLPLNRSALDGETFNEAELLLRWPDGRRRYLLASTAPIRDRAGGLNGAVAIVQDISGRKQAEEHSRQQAAQAEVRAALNQALAEAGLDFRAVLETIARRVAEATGDACAIHLASEDGRWLDMVAFHSDGAEAQPVRRPGPAGRRERVDQGRAGQVFQSGQALLVPVFEPAAGEPAGAEPAEWPEDLPVHSLLVVPLSAQGRPVGTLSVLRLRPGDAYTTGDMRFFESLAGRAALAIENARLYLAEAQRGRELNALHTATAALLSTLELNPLLVHIIDSAMSAIPAADNGALHLVAADTGELEIRAVQGFADPRLKRFSPRGSQGYPVQAVLERRPLLIDDSQGAVPPNGDESIRSAIVAPLLLHDRVLGALSLHSARPAAFSAADLRLLVSFAVTTTMAIHNATLHEQVQRQAITDALTGLYNRRGFFELGRREIERARRFGRPLAAIMLDIDYFKQVNDTHSHAIGDQVLQDLARRLAKRLREIDILGRYGGEEFVILLPENDLFSASNVAERLRAAIGEAPLQTDIGPLPLTASLGVTRLTPETRDLAELIHQADLALYRAKQAGRNRVEVG